jgi:hypothetical protein
MCEELEAFGRVTSTNWRHTLTLFVNTSDVTSVYLERLRAMCELAGLTVTAVRLESTSAAAAMTLTRRIVAAFNDTLEGN